MARRPFFMRFVEKQTPTDTEVRTEVRTDVHAGRTIKYPSDGDEEVVTMKYPSDKDEGGIDY